MRAVEWVLHHKAKSGLIAVAFANLIYWLWCTTANVPTSPLSKLLSPLVIVAGVLLNKAEARTDG